MRLFRWLFGIRPMRYEVYDYIVTEKGKRIPLYDRIYE